MRQLLLRRSDSKRKRRREEEWRQSSMKGRKLSLTHRRKRKGSERRRWRKGRRREEERGSRRKRRGEQLNGLQTGAVGGQNEKEGRSQPWTGVRGEKKEEVRQNDQEELGSLQREADGGTGRRRKKASGTGKLMIGQLQGGRMIDRLQDEMIEVLEGMRIGLLQEGMMGLQEGVKALEDGDEGMPRQRETTDRQEGTLEDEMLLQEGTTEIDPEISEPLEEMTEVQGETLEMIVVPGGTSGETEILIVDREGTSEGTETRIVDLEETLEATETLLEETLAAMMTAPLEETPLKSAVPLTGEGTAPLRPPEKKGTALLREETTLETAGVEVGERDLREMTLHHQDEKNQENDPRHDKTNLSLLEPLLNRLVKMPMTAGRPWPRNRVGSHEKFLDVLVSNTRAFLLHLAADLSELALSRPDVETKLNPVIFGKLNN